MSLIGAAVAFTAAGCLAATARQYRLYCKRAFALYLRLLDSDHFDAYVAELEELAQLSVAEAKESIATAREDNLHEQPLLGQEVDIVVSGGGFKVCYAGGIIRALQAAGMKPRRFAGCSAGAQISFLLLNGQLPAGVRWFHAVAETFRQYKYMRPAPLWDFFYRRCARQALLPEPGTFSVSITEVTRWLPTPEGRNQVIREFGSCDEVGDALMATASVPLLTGGLLGRRFRGMRVLDGGLTDNCPRFTDNVRTQLVITFDGLEQHWHGRMCGLWFTAKEMRQLVAMGLQDGCRLLRGEKVPGIEVVRLPQTSAEQDSAELLQDKCAERKAHLGAFMTGLRSAYTMRGADVAPDSLTGA